MQESEGTSSPGRAHGVGSSSSPARPARARSHGPDRLQAGPREGCPAARLSARGLTSTTCPSLAWPLPCPTPPDLQGGSGVGRDAAVILSRDDAAGQGGPGHGTHSCRRKARRGHVLGPQVGWGRRGRAVQGGAGGGDRGEGCVGQGLCGAGRPPILWKSSGSCTSTFSRWNMWYSACSQMGGIRLNCRATE